MRMARCCTIISVQLIFVMQKNQTNRVINSVIYSFYTIVMHEVAICDCKLRVVKVPLSF